MIEDKKGERKFTPAKKAAGKKTIVVAKKKAGKAITPLERGLLRKNNGRVEVPLVERRDDDTRAVWEHKMVAKVEAIMFQGFRTPHLIAELAKISVPEAKKYIRAVEAQWSVLGSSVDPRSARGEALANLEHLISQTWLRYNEAKKDANKKNNKGAHYRADALLRDLTSLQRQKMELNGIGAHTANSLLIAGGEADHPVLQAIRKQEKLVGVAAKFGHMLRKIRRRDDEALQKDFGLSAEDLPSTHRYDRAKSEVSPITKLKRKTA